MQSTLQALLTSCPAFLKAPASDQWLAASPSRLGRHQTPWGLTSFCCDYPACCMLNSSNGSSSSSSETGHQAGTTVVECRMYIADNPLALVMHMKGVALMQIIGVVFLLITRGCPRAHQGDGYRATSDRSCARYVAAEPMHKLLQTCQTIHIEQQHIKLQRTYQAPMHLTSMLFADTAGSLSMQSPSLSTYLTPHGAPAPDTSACT